MVIYVFDKYPIQGKIITERCKDKILMLFGINKNRGAEFYTNIDTLAKELEAEGYTRKDQADYDFVKEEDVIKAIELSRKTGQEFYIIGLPRCFRDDLDETKFHSFINHIHELLRE